MGDDLEAAAADAAKLTETEFGKRHPIAGVICYRALSATASADAEEATRHAQREALVNPRTAVLQRPAAAELRKVERMYFLRKAGAGFTKMITVGRTPRADIPLISEGVSKMHAYFSWSETRDKYFITDNRSTNGTRVDGAAIPPQQAIELKDQSAIQMGGFELKFMRPKTLYHFLRAVR
jgi:pSer/pThr/pTyr-binding forkhead associated (FHA) protein